MEVINIILFFLVGAILSSFYGVASTRIPEGKSIIKPRSHCSSCNHELSWKDLIPIFSFLILKGKCRYCQKSLPIYEPILELSMGIFFALAYYYYGFSYNLWISLLILSLIDLIFVSDFLYMIILDSPLVITSILTFILNLIYFDFNKAIYSLISGVVLFAFMILVGYIGKLLFKREALGGGDIKLSFVVGLILGIPHAFMALVLSTFLALPYATYSIFSKTSREVAFGPFIIGALAIVFFYYDKFSYILRLFS